MVQFMSIGKSKPPPRVPTRDVRLIKLVGVSVGHGLRPLGQLLGLVGVASGQWTRPTHQFFCGSGLCLMGGSWRHAVVTLGTGAT